MALSEVLERAGVRSDHFYAASLGSIGLCVGLWIRAKTVDQDERGNAERRALFWPPTKIAGRYLSPYLLSLSETADQASEPDGQAVELDLEREVPAAADALDAARRH